MGQGGPRGPVCHPLCKGFSVSRGDDMKGMISGGPRSADRGALLHTHGLTNSRTHTRLTNSTLTNARATTNYCPVHTRTSLSHRPQHNTTHTHNVNTDVTKRSFSVHITRNREWRFPFPHEIKVRRRKTYLERPERSKTASIPLPPHVLIRLLPTTITPSHNTKSCVSSITQQKRTDNVICAYSL